jgi:chromosomal replication initiation ATPase DnaA
MILPENNIYEVVSSVTKIPIKDIQGKKRQGNIVEAKMLTRYFLHIYCDLNKSEVARATRCDHTTILHSFKKLDDIINDRARGYERILKYYNECNDIFNRYRRKYRIYYTLPNPNPSINDRRH